MDSQGREGLLKYILRPPIAQERVTQGPDGLVRIALKRPFAEPQGQLLDNAVAESFFATLKTELVYLRRFATKAEAREAIFEFIETFYNRERRHSTLGFLSPVEFERRFDQEKRVEEEKKAA
jgi:transposase InsO family protein